MSMCHVDQSSCSDDQCMKWLVSTIGMTIKEPHQSSVKAEPQPYCVVDPRVVLLDSQVTAFTLEEPNIQNPFVKMTLSPENGSDWPLSRNPSIDRSQTRAYHARKNPKYYS